VGVLRGALRGLAARALAAALALAPVTRAAADEATAPAESWATLRARELTASGAALRQSGRVGDAVARFTEALKTDGTYGPAYLALAELREATGEVEEAEKVLLLGMQNILGFWEGLMAQAELVARQRRFDDATALLLAFERGNPDHEGALRRLIDVATRADRLPVALRAARRLHELATLKKDDAARKSSAATVRALTLLLGETDPVAAGPRHREVARRALARYKPR
jgi:tetratricopeptide (TPR) repeat protein